MHFYGNSGRLGFAFRHQYDTVFSRAQRLGKFEFVMGSVKTSVRQQNSSAPRPSTRGIQKAKA